MQDETHMVYSSEKGIKYISLNLLWLLGILGKAARLNISYELVSIVTVKMLASGREKWRHSLAMITGTAYCQASSD